MAKFFVQMDDFSIFLFWNILPRIICEKFIFEGITRDNFDGKKVLRLEYEAYKPMAKKKMKEICDSIRKQWQIHSIAMIHRIK